MTMRAGPSPFVVQLRAGSAHLPLERLSGKRERTVRSGRAAAFVTVVDRWLSGLSSRPCVTERRLEGLDAGANDDLVKPFSARELLARVSTQVQLAKLRPIAESERARFLSFLMQLPVPITVFESPNHRVALKNPLADEVTQGKLRLRESLVDLLPELEADGLIQRFDEVYISGQATQPIPQPIRLMDGEGALRERCFANVLQPLRDAHGIMTGILAAGSSEALPLRHSVVLPVSARQPRPGQS